MDTPSMLNADNWHFKYRYFLNYVAGHMAGFIVFVCILVAGKLHCQPQTTQLAIALRFNGKPIEKGKSYITKNSDTIVFEQIKWYFSSIEYIEKDHTPLVIQERPILYDWQKPSTLAIQTCHQLAREGILQFTVGINEALNKEPNFEDDLDPIYGMYWAWQSGYIFIKIEGKSPSLTTLKNKFQFHLGGFADPYNAARQVRIPITPEAKSIVIDLGEFFNAIDLQTTNAVMTPGQIAVNLASQFQAAIFIE